ncbi:response regulator [Aestuariibaculum sediminum]|uniref:Response regulator transcription factor n=1 Tax=Aestuariibaculum sediminum TaxID=2770637 RepID=A0A8J6Q8K5_9FLAO|nr:response regulator [Aestuariibaculum sediminum]MBD0832820.1 response regulator transcription factor [Aestuariibaculum sediminum]
MNNTYQTLIIEDHPFIMEGYTRVLEHISKSQGNYSFNISTAKNCDEAILEIEHALNHNILDLVFLDISLPASNDRKFLSGDDLGIKIRASFPMVKIIIATHLENNYRLVNILKTIQPNGLLLKNELTFKNLTDGVLNILNDIPFYSSPILKLVRQHISNDFNLDNIDRQILYHLSLGTKTKELPNLVHLSISGIENRKRRLNLIFNNEKKNDKNLLKLAKEYGFL